jgi:hypothetical protein
MNRPSLRPLLLLSGSKLVMLGEPIDEFAPQVCEFAPSAATGRTPIRIVATNERTLSGAVALRASAIHVLQDEAHNAHRVTRYA